VPTEALQCIVVTPEKTLLDQRADFIAVPAYDGQIGVLHGRSACVWLLGHGELRIRSGDQVDRYYVEEGFVQIHDDVVTVLTDTAVAAADLDAAAVEERLAEAQLMTTPDPRAASAKFTALSRAYAQKRLLART